LLCAENMTLATIITEFRDIVDAIYGTFLDARAGFLHVRARAGETEEESKRSWEELKTKRPELAHLPFGGGEFSYGRLVPAGSQPRYRHLHQVPIETLKQRNEDGGTNFQFVGNMCLVTLYQYWDEYYRSLLAQALEVKENQIQVLLFGDMRQYRHAIIHNRGLATTEVEKCEMLRWFKRGEPILLSRDMFEEMIDDVFEVLDVFQKEPAQYIQCA
jgi:hypothetical protein